VVETNWHYHHYLETPDDGLSPVSDMTEYQIFLFTAVTIQMGHCIQNQLTRVLDNCGLLLHAFVQQPDKMRQIPTHPLLFTLLR
jgi:hypothetical protein